MPDDTYRDYPRETRPGAPTRRAESNRDIIRVLLSVLLPPLGVFLQERFGFHFWLNILLTLLGYVPGIIHAVWIILRRD